MGSAKLQTQQSQKQTLSQEQILVTRFLQIPSEQLRLEAEALLASNPLLQSTNHTNAPKDKETSSLEEETPSASEADDATPPLPDPAEDETYNDETWGKASNASEDWDPFENVAALEDSKASLLSDARCLTRSPLEETLVTCLIDELDEHGFLTSSLSTLVQEYTPVLAQEGYTLVTLADWENAKNLLTRFDPPGLGASGPMEALRLQIHQKIATQPERRELFETLLLIITESLTDLLQRNESKLLTYVNQNSSRLEALYDELKGLNPFPWGNQNNEITEYIEPDLMVVHEQDQWHLVINAHHLPAIDWQETQELRRLEKTMDKTTWQSYFQEARLLLTALQSRMLTLSRLGHFLFETQKAWITHPEATLKALSMPECAQALGLSVSTVSRACSGKYMLTPRGLIPLKNLFNASRFSQNAEPTLAASSPEDASSDAIRAKIRALIEAENPQKPLSDQAIADALEAQGLHVARRTVTKYRELDQIPAARLRKRCL